MFFSISGYIQQIKRKNKSQKFNKDDINIKPNEIHLLNIKNDNLDYTIIPYNFDFDDTWSIANEFLKFIEKNNDLNHLYENKVNVINPAYCIEALEFKRYINKYINKFDVEKPENKFILNKLDTILQRFADGESKFSFLSDQQFEENKKIEISFLEKLISEYKQLNLKSILEYVKKSKNNKYTTQTLSEEQTLKIVNYVANEDTELLKTIISFIPGDIENIFYKQLVSLGLKNEECK